MPRKKTARNPLVQHRYEDNLRVKLTEAEVAERAALCARKIATIDQTEEERRISAGEYRDQLKSLHMEVRDLSRKVREREEVRAVECEVLLRPETGKAETVRTDTGEIIHTRAMTDAERQGNLFPIEEAAPA